MAEQRTGTSRIPPMSWWILGLMTFEYALAMIDRNVVSILKTTLKGVYQIDDAQYGLLVTAFMVPYALFYVVCGALADRLGSRIGFTLFVGAWSLATVAAGLSNSFPELVFWRVVLGVAEAGLLPATMIALVTWFPRDKLATAYAIKTPLQSLGPIVSPPLIAWLAITYSWRMAFLVPGVIGLICAVLWWLSDRNPPKFVPAPAEAVAQAEGPAEPRLSMRDLLRNRFMITLLLARLASDPVWFFFQHWQAGYLQEQLGLSLADVGRLLWIPPALTAVLTFVTATWSDKLIARGHSAIHSRILVLGSTTVLAPLILVLLFVQSVWVVLAILATTYFMAFTWLYLTNILTADLFPKSSVGRAIGLVGMVGTIGAAAFNWGAGHVIEAFGYAPMFVLCALLHPLALLILWLRLRKAWRADARRGGRAYCVTAKAPPSSGHSDTILVSTPVEISRSR